MQIKTWKSEKKMNTSDLLGILFYDFENSSETYSFLL